MPLIQIQFFYTLHAIEQSMGNTDLIIGGDFNQVKNNTLDRSDNAGRSRNIQKSMIAIDTISEELGLVDIWRLMHPQQGEYTFFSNPHAYSRIDYFLISKQLVPMVEQTSVDNIVITDHGPVDTILKLRMRGVLLAGDLIHHSFRTKIHVSLLDNKY